MAAAGPAPLITAEAIAERVHALAQRITRDYRERDLLLVGVLEGAFVFLADLCRQIELPLECDFVSIQSYGDQTESSGNLTLSRDLVRSPAGRDVLIVEDIVDTGLTADFMFRHLESRGPASVALCSLLRKQGRARRDVPVAYLGFTVPDQFIVGYGLDRAGRYRNLPYLAALPGT